MSISPAIVTRFAPSPTGRLHLGHAYSALFAEAAARQSNGRFLLRIEDIDPARCRPEFEQGILEDLSKGAEGALITSAAKDAVTRLSRR